VPLHAQAEVVRPGLSWSVEGAVPRWARGSARPLWPTGCAGWVIVRARAPAAARSRTIPRASQPRLGW